MKFLVIGGTRFVGYNFIKTLLAQGHEVTTFNRGKYNPNAFDGKVEKIIGDRDGEISKIGDRHFDVVFDSCGYIPRVVKQSVDYLKDKATWYVFVSTISVYEELGPNRDEDGNYIYHVETGPVNEVEDKTMEDVDNAYGALKALCEQVVLEGFPDRSIALRCGHIIGPYDYGNRLMYWVLRIRNGEKVLAPGEKTLKYQFIDARDIADFTLKLLEAKKSGIYNVTGPEELFSFKEMLQEIKEVTNSNAEFVWASDQFLVDNVKEYGEFSMWHTPKFEYMFACDISKALADGLKFTPFKQTVRDTLAWYDKIDEVPKTWRQRLTEDKEKALIEKLQKNN